MIQLLLAGAIGASAATLTLALAVWRAEARMPTYRVDVVRYRRSVESIIGSPDVASLDETVITLVTGAALDAAVVAAAGDTSTTRRLIDESDGSIFAEFTIGDGAGFGL